MMLLIRFAQTFANHLLGPKCDLCGERVYSKDKPAHTRREHAEVG